MLESAIKSASSWKPLRYITDGTPKVIWFITVSFTVTEIIKLKIERSLRVNLRSSERLVSLRLFIKMSRKIIYQVTNKNFQFIEPSMKTLYKMMWSSNKMNSIFDALVLEKSNRFLFAGMRFDSNSFSAARSFEKTTFRKWEKLLMEFCWTIRSAHSFFVHCSWRQRVS